MTAFTIAAAGRMKTGDHSRLCNDYLKRLTWPVKLVEVEARPGLAGSALRLAEAGAIRARLPETAAVVALDERGRSLTSPELAQWIGTAQSEATAHIAFVIGGADGLHETLRSQARLVLSFGQLTWPHMLARVMLLEQLYRAQTILAGHPYHRG